MSNGLYNTILFIHIVAAIASLGGGLLFVGTVQSALKKEGQAAADQQLRRFAWADNRIFTAGALALIASGVALVVARDAWRFSQTWIWLALTLFVLAFVLAGGVAGRMQKTLHEAGEVGTVETPEYLSQLQSFLRTHSVLNLVLFAIAALMVYKPGV